MQKLPLMITCTLLHPCNSPSCIAVLQHVILYERCHSVQATALPNCASQLSSLQRMVSWKLRRHIVRWLGRHMSTIKCPLLLPVDLTCSLYSSYVACICSEINQRHLHLSVHLTAGFSFSCQPCLAVYIQSTSESAGYRFSLACLSC